MPESGQRLTKIKKMVNDALYSCAWDDGLGYYFAENMQGTELINRNNPEYPGKHVPKISFVKYFARFDWVIGNGNYSVNEEEKMIPNGQIHLGKRILLVEDDVDISDVQYVILYSSRCNHKVNVAHSGHMALDLFDRQDQRREISDND